MNIKSITIKNIRGLQNHTVQLNMIPNKPSLLVAPNGSGKSSLAIAFQSLSRGKLIVNKDNIHSGNQNLVPEIILETDDQLYRANPTTNEISGAFDIAVINNRTKPIVIKRKVNGVMTPTTRLSVEPIVLESHVPQKVKLDYDFGESHGITLKKGVMPSINPLLKKNSLYEEFPVAELKNIATTLKVIVDLIKGLAESEITANDMRAVLVRDVLPKLQSRPKVRIIAEAIRAVEGGRDTELNVYLKAMQLLLVFDQYSKAFKDNKDYAHYCRRKESYCELFNSLKKTWQGIKPKESDGKLLVEIPNASLLSNGERDIIIFLAMLEKAKLTLKKEENILIIDEVFDYLDDANLVAAQYYISEFIKDMKGKGKGIFPVILTHLNPDYYKHYAFKELKVYYLIPLPNPQKSNLMMDLLRKREELEKSGAEDVISKYMLHYHKDYTQDLSEALNQDLRNAHWNDVPRFKEYCKSNVEHYLDNEEFCPLAVCVMLREWIESFCYQHLSEDKKNDFLNVRSTQRKLLFAEGNGVDCPEIFSLLGLIYNDPLHATDKKDLRQTLYSRLHNNTIKAMITQVKDMCDKQENKS